MSHYNGDLCRSRLSLCEYSRISGEGSGKTSGFSRPGRKILRDTEIGDQILDRENIKRLFPVSVGRHKRKKHQTGLRFDLAPRASVSSLK